MPFASFRSRPRRGRTRQRVQDRQAVSFRPGPSLTVAGQEQCLDNCAVRRRLRPRVVASGGLPPGVAADYLSSGLPTSAADRASADPGYIWWRVAAHFVRVFLLRRAGTAREMRIELLAEPEQLKAPHDSLGCVVVSLGSQGALLATTYEPSIFVDSDDRGWRCRRRRRDEWPRYRGPQRRSLIQSPFAWERGRLQPCC